MENATSSPEYPPDSGTWELSAVIYVAVCLFVLFVIHGSMERRGRMKWSKLRWEHVAESSRGCSTSCMAVWRFFCCVLVILNNVVMVFVSDSASKLVAGYMAQHINFVLCCSCVAFWATMTLFMTDR